MRISDWSSDVCSSDLLALAILMYLSPVMWMGFLLAGLLRAAATALFPGTDLTVAPAVWERVASGEGVALFATMMAIVFAPKLLGVLRSEEHTSELQSLMRISYAVFCLKKKKTPQ